MLTPEQIQNHSFRSAGKGLYRSEDVDTFFQEAVKAFTETQENAAQLQKNNDELYQRVEALANALNQLRAERELIQKTMILAQKAADDISAKAQEESARLTREAQFEADRLRRESREEATTLVNTAKAEVEKLILETQAQAENIQAQARARAESLFEEARAKAQQELTRISSETQREQQELQRLHRETAVFRDHLLDAVARQMELIEQMPEPDAVLLPQDAQPKPEPKPEPITEPKPGPKPEAKPEPAPEPEPLPADMNDEDAFAQLTAALEQPGKEGFHFVK